MAKVSCQLGLAVGPRQFQLEWNGAQNALELHTQRGQPAHRRPTIVPEDNLSANRAPSRRSRARLAKAAHRLAASTTAAITRRRPNAPGRHGLHLVCLDTGHAHRPHGATLSGARERVSGRASDRLIPFAPAPDKAALGGAYRAASCGRASGHVRGDIQPFGRHFCPSRADD